MEPMTTYAHKEYEHGFLDEPRINRDPIRKVAAWYDAAAPASPDPRQA